MAPGPALPVYPAGEWNEYPPPPPEQYVGPWIPEQYQYAEAYAQAEAEAAGQQIARDPRSMTQEEKDRGLGSVFKRDDQRLLSRRERDAREKDPNFISESYSECYPGYQEYNREIVESDEDEDLSKMDMGGRVRQPYSIIWACMTLVLGNSFCRRVAFTAFPEVFSRVQL